MDLEYTNKEKTFRDDIRAFIRQNLSKEVAAKVLEHKRLEKEDHVRWQKILYEQGWIAPGWPVEYGGTGWNPVQRHILEEECAEAGAPPVMAFGVYMVGPVIIAFGSPQQKQHYLPRILSSEDWWCQGYSEPGAGSDLANVSTAAELDGDQWVINGQKVWTSMAHLAQWCFVVARTEKGSKRHAGLSYLLVPLDQPGVEIRPIVQLTGAADFNEVFFDDARTDADLVVGDPGDGWRVAMGTLTFERGVSTLGQQIRYAREHSNLVDVAKRTGAVDDPLIRERLTRSWVGLQTMRSYALATMDVEQPGQDNVSKLLWANWHRDLGELAMDIVGMAGLVAEDGELDVWQHLYLFTRADTIYGGSNEIQRNIIAERVLGLPREVRG